MASSSKVDATTKVLSNKDLEQGQACKSLAGRLFKPLNVLPTGLALLEKVDTWILKQTKLHEHSMAFDALCKQCAELAQLDQAALNAPNAYTASGPVAKRVEASMALQRLPPEFLETRADRAAHLQELVDNTRREVLCHQKRVFVANIADVLSAVGGLLCTEGGPVGAAGEVAKDESAKASSIESLVEAASSMCKTASQVYLDKLGDPEAASRFDTEVAERQSFLSMLRVSAKFLAKWWAQPKDWAKFCKADNLALTQCATWATKGHEAITMGDADLVKKWSGASAAMLAALRCALAERVAAIGKEESVNKFAMHIMTSPDILPADRRGIKELLALNYRSAEMNAARHVAAFGNIHGLTLDAAASATPSFAPTVAMILLTPSIALLSKQIEDLDPRVKAESSEPTATVQALDALLKRGVVAVVALRPKVAEVKATMKMLLPEGAPVQCAQLNVAFAKKVQQFLSTCDARASQTLDAVRAMRDTLHSSLVSASTQIRGTLDPLLEGDLVDKDMGKLKAVSALPESVLFFKLWQEYKQSLPVLAKICEKMLCADLPEFQALPGIQATVGDLIFITACPRDLSAEETRRKLIKVARSGTSREGLPVNQKLVQLATRLAKDGDA